MARPGTLRELIVKLGIDFDKRGAAVADVALSRLKFAAIGLAGAFSAVKVFQGIKSATQEVFTAADEIDKMSNRLGIGTQSLQELMFAAKMTDVEIGELNSGLRNLTKTSFGALKGGGDLQKTFSKLGISAADLKGPNGLKNADQLLGLVAGGFKNIKSNSEKAAIAQQIFGKSGTAFIPLLNDLEKLRGEAGDTGAILSGETIQAAQELEHSLKLLDAQTFSLKAVIGGELIPQINELVKTFSEWFRKNKDTIRQKMHAVFNVIGKSIRFAARMLERFFQLTDLAIDFAAAIWEMKWAVLAATAAIGAMFAVSNVGFAGLAFWIASTSTGLLGLAATALTAFAPFILPALAAAAAVSVLYLWIEDFLVFLEGGDSVIGDFIKALENLVTFKDLLGFFAELGTKAGKLWVVAMINAITLGLLNFIPAFRNWQGRFLSGDKNGGDVEFEDVASLAQFATRPILPGGAGSPSIAAQGASIRSLPAQTVNASSVNNFTITAAPGMAPGDVANETARILKERETKMFGEALRSLTPAPAQ